MLALKNRKHWCRKDYKDARLVEGQRLRAQISPIPKCRRKDLLGILTAFVVILLNEGI